MNALQWIKVKTWNCLAYFGLLCIGCLIYWAACDWYEGHVAAQSMPLAQAAGEPIAIDGTSIKITPTAQKLAGLIVPELTALVHDLEPDVLASLNGIERWVCKRLYPRLIKGVPHAAEVSCEYMLDKLGGMTAQQLAQMVVEHAEAKRTEVNWSVRALAEVHQFGRP